MGNAEDKHAKRVPLQHATSSNIAADITQRDPDRAHSSEHSGENAAAAAAAAPEQENKTNKMAPHSWSKAHSGHPCNSCWAPRSYFLPPPEASRKTCVQSGHATANAEPFRLPRTRHTHTKRTDRILHHTLAPPHPPPFPCTYIARARSARLNALFYPSGTRLCPFFSIWNLQSFASYRGTS